MKRIRNSSCNTISTAHRRIGASAHRRAEADLRSPAPFR
jgi:hypothetical protein